jgi:23S rRNA-/tRNA-specific pseudouridylate synthase
MINLEDTLYMTEQELKELSLAVPVLKTKKINTDVTIYFNDDHVIIENKKGGVAEVQLKRKTFEKIINALGYKIML